MNASCPLELNPPSVVARYGDIVSVNCSTPSADHEGMGWEAEIGSTDLAENVTFVTWTVETSRIETWNVAPDCYITPAGETHNCLVSLTVTLYSE